MLDYYVTVSYHSVVGRNKRFGRKWQTRKEKGNENNKSQGLPV